MRFTTVSLRKITRVWWPFVLLGISLVCASALTRQAVGDDRPKDSNEKRATAPADEKPQNAVPAPPGEKDAATVPELVYMTWQKSKEANGRRALNPLWNVKGDVVPFDEAKQAVLATDSFNVHWWKPEEALRPLVFVFRVEPKFSSHVVTTAIDDRGRRHASGTFMAGKGRGWSVSAASPSKNQLAEWPKQISLEMKYAIEGPQLLRTIDKIPEGAVPIADGLEWSVEDNRGLGDQKPAAVLRCQYGQGDWQLHTYDIRTYLRGKKEPLEEMYATRVDDEKAGKAFELRVSASIDNRRDVERIEIWRRRNEVRRIDGIPVRLDLQPKDEAAEENK